ncbi:MAG: hypothetical protein ABJH85_11530 [Paracoccaceae bacterium]
MTILHFQDAFGDDFNGPPQSINVDNNIGDGDFDTAEEETAIPELVDPQDPLPNQNPAQAPDPSQKADEASG